MTDEITEEEAKGVLSQLEVAVQLADLEEKSQDLTLTLFGRDYPITVKGSDRPKIRCFKCNKMTMNFVTRFLNEGEVKANLCRKCATYHDNLTRCGPQENQDLYFKGKE